MRYSRYALLIFGAGMLLGLAVVSADLSGLARIASATMAAGIALLPLAVIADLWRHKPKPKVTAKSPKPRARRQPGRQPKSSPPRNRGSRRK